MPESGTSPWAVQTIEFKTNFRKSSFCQFLWKWPPVKPNPRPRPSPRSNAQATCCGCFFFRTASRTAGFPLWGPSFRDNVSRSCGAVWLGGARNSNLSTIRREVSLRMGSENRKGSYSAHWICVGSFLKIWRRLWWLLFVEWLKWLIANNVTSGVVVYEW